ncbi:hypothetical protein [Nitrosomonas communis]|uniref:Uncharacterized protein n=1 Tax=Nitrosomonas communis TaxID=44574 RepID=A0A1H2RBP0_9PROT|nr:hypothetical protein [Nitrosomonas communis]SDW16560.1 hypothetical protein SAMN05421882_100447 [Nitrosomonas communis]
MSGILIKLRKKKEIPQSILNKFRNKYQSIKDIEAKNGLNINLSLAISLIEKLRHVIVHKGGKVSNKDNFIKLTLENCGLSNNGKNKQEHIDFINQYFGSGEYENLITLLEIRIREDLPIKIERDVLSILIGYLIGYAFLIIEMTYNQCRSECT